MIHNLSSVNYQSKGDRLAAPAAILLRRELILSAVKPMAGAVGSPLFTEDIFFKNASVLVNEYPLVLNQVQLK